MIKKICVMLTVFIVTGAAAPCVRAQEAAIAQESAAAQETAAPLSAAPAPEPLPVYMQPDKEQRKAFKQRGKQVRRLVKKYRKAKSSEEKTILKEQLAQIISDTTDANMAWALARVSAEKENLSHWEQKLQERQKKLDEIKARRVDELLSGEAEQRFKLAKKRWKKELQSFKQSMK